MIRERIVSWAAYDHDVIPVLSEKRIFFCGLHCEKKHQSECGKGNVSVVYYWEWLAVQAVLTEIISQGYMWLLNFKRQDTNSFIME